MNTRELDCLCGVSAKMSNRSIMLAPLLHPAPRSGEGGPPCSARVVEGASDSNLARPHAPSTTLRVVPLPRTSCGSGQNEIVLATHSRARALPTTTTPFPKISSLPAKKGAERRKAHANHRRHADKCVVCAARLRSGRQRALSGRARLPALCCGTRQGERIRRWLSSSSRVS